MRHKKATKKLNKPVGHRRSMLNNLLTQLYTHESIISTDAKAKVVKSLADKLIHQAKSQTVAVRRRLHSQVADPLVLKKLVDDIAQRYPDVSSGFTRITRLGSRQGDNALLAKLELTNKSLVNQLVQKANPEPNKTVSKKPANQTVKKTNKVKTVDSKNKK